MQNINKIIKFYDLGGCVKPSSRENHVGVEIECILPFKRLGRVFLAQKLFEAKLANKVRIGDDDSIKYKIKSYSGVEIRIIDTEDKIKATFEKVVSILKSSGAYINSTCGMHVHLDMRKRNLAKRIIIFNNLRKSENFLFSLVKKDRNTNRFCIPFPKIITIAGKKELTIDADFNTNWIYVRSKRLSMNLENAIIHVKRRTALNFSSYREHKTFEIRMHEGTLNPSKFNKWIDVLLAIVHQKNEFKRPLPVKKKGMEVLGL